MSRRFLSTFSTRNLIAFFLLILFNLLLVPFGIVGQPTPPACPTCPPPVPQTIYAPTIGLPEATGSEIVLNCRSSHVMDVTPTFYTKDGDAIVGAMFQMQPSEMKFVTINSLIPEEHRGQHVWGGMSLAYTGKSLEMWAQITLHGLDGIGSADVVFAQSLGRGTDTQEAVWFMPNGRAKAILALGNSSDQVIQTYLSFSNGDEDTVSIQPHGTRYVRRNDDDAMGVKLITTGPAGALRATGFVTKQNQKFTSGIRFYETQAAVQPNLYASNLLIKNHNPHMLLRNTTDASINAQPTFRPTDGDGPEVTLDPVTLNAGEIREIDLQPLKVAANVRNDLDSVSVKIVNSAGPGTLIGALYSINQNTKITQDIPLRDSGKMRTSTGAYPWRLDDDYSSTIYINNVGAQTADYVAKLYYDGGTYTMSMQKLATGKTASYNIKRIRDEQIPDKDGNTLPANATVGQFAWSMIHITDESQLKLVGRSEVVSKIRKVDSSYSCPVCCPNWGPGYSPQSVSVARGDSSGYYLDGFWYDCYYRLAGTTQDTLAVSVINSAIASASMADGLFETDGIEAGETSWVAPYYWYFYWDDGMDCYPAGENIETGGPIEVPCPTSISQYPNAYPTNFRVKSGFPTTPGNGVLHFEYEWDSSDGNVDHLYACQTRECVKYVSTCEQTPVNFLPQSPPYIASAALPDPTILVAEGSAAHVPSIDNHSIPGSGGGTPSFRTPYSAYSFTGTQKYQYKCLCNHENQWVDLVTNISIVRDVSVANSIWTYTITKSGGSASYTLP